MKAGIPVLLGFAAAVAAAGPFPTVWDPVPNAVDAAPGARPQPPPPQPAPRPQPSPPPRRPGTTRVHGPSLPWTTPRVTDWETDGRGRVRSYHVVSPAVVEDPFGGISTVLPSSAPPPPPREVHVRHFVLPRPTEEEAAAREAASLAAAGTELERSVAFDDASMRKAGVPLVRTFYRQGPEGPVPAVRLSVLDGAVRQETDEDAAALPVPTEAQILEAFRAGAEFRVVRPVQVPVPCGACGGAKTVASERVERDDGSPPSEIRATCSRCSGAGTVRLSVPCVFTVSRKRPAGGG